MVEALHALAILLVILALGDRHNAVRHNAKPLCGTGPDGKAAHKPKPPRR